MRWWQRWLILIIPLFIIGVFTGLWYFADVPIASPLTNLTTFQFLKETPPRSEGKIVYGFVPYWNVKTTQMQPELTHLSYFGLGIGADGSLLTKEGENIAPGYNALQSEEFLTIINQASKNNTKLELVLIQFEPDTIQALLSSPTAIDKLTNSLDQVLLAYPFSGINIDIEYSGDVSDTVRDQLVDFVAALNNHLDRKYKNVHLSIDMYAGAAARRQIWDVERIAPHVDHIVIMAYDFHRKSSPQAGPIAPLFGGDNEWDSDINQYIAKFVQVVPREKLLLGVPFYGYEWQTTSRHAKATTYPDTGSTATFKRIQELLKQQKELDVQLRWDELALSPYLSYEKDGETYVVYYENSRSLSYKLDYVNQLGLGGIAIWALGYEDENRELWDVISRKL